MDWSQILTVVAVVLANLGTIISLYIHLDNKTDARIQAIQASVDGMREDSKAFQQAMLNESKEFHGRLCAIEERAKISKQEKKA
jgi:hypothetical protein